MRRVVLLIVLVLGATLASTGVAAAAENRCTVTITPTVGNGTDTYRITVSGLVPDPGFVEVRVHLRLLGTRTGSIYFAFLVPETSEFYIDHNSGDPSEPPLTPGRYLVRVTTPHISGADGCHAVGLFRIV